MANTINGILKVKRGTEYVTLYPRTAVNQVEEFADGVATLTDPVRNSRKNFETTNPTIPKGRLAVDEYGFKIGDGRTKWKSLDYVKIDPTNIVNFVESVAAVIKPIKMTRAQFLAEDPPIGQNQFAVESDQGGIKIGDGTTKWSELPYVGGMFTDAIINLFDPAFNTRQGFTNANPVISKGRLAIETDKGGIKVGDGVTAWGSLAYIKIDLAQIVDFNNTVLELTAPIKMTRAKFAEANETIAANKLCIETDKGGIKIGDGSTKWANLPYIGQDDNKADVLYIYIKEDNGKYSRVS